jgi:GT2 family glycosyltransferase
MNKIAAVVVTYNRLELLKQCVESLKKQTVPCDILLVNNNSTDTTEEWATSISEENDKIKYRNTGANIGGAGGFNFGMRWAVEAGYEFVWLMDDDCLPYEDSLQELLNTHEKLNGKYGWLSSAVLWKDGTACMMNRQKLEENFYEQMELIQFGLVRAKQATFVSLFLRAETIKQVGLPIKEFFIWGDDVEYTRRIAVRCKMPSFLAGKSQVLHMMGSNSGSNIATDGKERLERYNYAFRNENYLYRKEGIKGILYYVAKCGWNIIKILRFAKDSRFLRCYIILKNMVIGLFFNPDVEKI